MGQTDSMYTILGIESSCDDSAAAICRGGQICANVVSRQLDHAQWGGVVPELASRLHQVWVPAVVQQALADAKLTMADLDAIAVTTGPGLMGALLVGTCYAKGLAMGLGKHLIAVDHLQGHLASLFTPPINLPDWTPPALPMVVLTVSGGHTQLQVLRSPLQAEVIGRTRDDAAGEAFDKAAKLLGLPYPGGPELDRLAEAGDPHRHPDIARPDVPGLDFSFSGLKTSFRYYLQKQQQADPTFLARERPHLAAALRHRVVHNLLDKLFQAAEQHGVQSVGIAGGVSANVLLRRAFLAECQRRGLDGRIPPFAYCTDNAAMIAWAGSELHRQRVHADAYTVAYASGG